MYKTAFQIGLKKTKPINIPLKKKCLNKVVKKCWKLKNGIRDKRLHTEKLRKKALIADKVNSG